jgi:glutamate--cysteine ligase
MWREVDNARTGLLPFVFADDFGYRDYVEYALDVPLVFLRREGGYLPVHDITFRQYIEKGWNGTQANLTDFENHVSVLFPEVRLKRFIEVRCGDSVPPALALAMIALWKGLLYDEQSLKAVTDLCAGFSMPERRAMQIAAAQDALHGRGPTFHLGELASEVVKLGHQGLARAAVIDAKGRDETRYLEPLAEIVTSRETLADRAIKRWGQGPWGGATKLAILADGVYSAQQIADLER